MAENPFIEHEDARHHDHDFRHNSDSDTDSSSYYEPEYEEELVRIGNRIDLHVLSLLPPPLEFLSALRSEHKEISGRQVWTGSLLLANLLCTEPYQGCFDNKKILELGSGTGILGMAISKLATNSQIVLTDGDPLAINLLQQNLNHSSNYIDKQTVQSTLLLWSNSINQNHPFCDWCRHQWSSKQEDDYTTETGFDVIMAGDVLYKAELPPLFFATVKALLVSNGVLYLCHVPRATVTHAIVRNAAISAGFKVEEIDIKTSVTPDLLEGCVMEDVERARVYRMVLKQ